MDWTELLHAEMDETYHAANGLMDLVADDELSWKPGTGDNWMTMGQLLKHLGSACGWCSQQFVENTWDSAMGNMPDPMPSVATVAEAKEGLAADRELARQMVEKAGADALANQPTPAPWNPTPTPLGRQLLSMTSHLAQHKAQLFYYLKLQGKPVNTMHLWGMTPPEEAST